MSHDDKNKNPDLNLWIDPELEARVIAWVLGEVSDFEAAELERLMEETPEVRLFRDRIQAAHDLAGDVMGPDQEELKLSPERRAELLAKISEPTETIEDEQPMVYHRSPLINWRKWIPAGAVSVAASFILVFGVIRMGMPDFSGVMFDASQADMNRARDVRSVEMPPPSAEMMELEMKAGRSTGGATLNRQNVEPLSLRQLEIALDPGVGGASGATDQLGVQGYGDFSSVAAPVDTSMSFKNEGAGSKEFLYVRSDLDRMDAKKPSLRRPSPSQAITGPMADEVAAMGSYRKEGAENEERSYKLRQRKSSDANNLAAAGQSDSFLTGEVAYTPEDKGWLRAKETDREEIVTLSAFEVSTKDDVAGSRAGDSADDSPLNGRDVSELRSNSETALEEKAQTAGSSVVQKKIKNFIEVLKSSNKPVENLHTLFETNAIEEPVSTFSLHVSDVSFRTAQAALARGDWPESSTIRPEEFYNAFDYGDPVPTTAEKISCRIDQAAHPTLQQRNLVRIAMKVPATGRGAGQPLHLTVMVDTSGSMEREDRRESVENAMNVLSTLLGPDDRINVIGFARQPRLLEEAMPGNEAHRLADVIASTPSEGGTNLEEALRLSVQLAQRHYDPSAQNRIVLITDGAANLGNADPDSLTGTIEMIRQQGISFDACGVGMDGLNDAILEALTRKGDGRYYVLDRPEDADEGFADQLAGAFRPAAENVKVQVRFNPARVGNYRLIGFEKHRLNEEDFRNDRVDAAELAAEEAAVALYQVEVLSDGEGELGEVYVRFRDTATGEMIERSWTAPYDPHAPTFDRASPAVQLAGTAAVLAEVLRGDPNAEQISLDDLATTINQLRGHYAHEERVQELVGMYEDLRRIQNMGAE